LLAEAVHPFCQASGAVVNLGKCWGMSLGDHPPLVGMHPDTGICFVAKVVPVAKHQYCCKGFGMH